MSSATRRPPLVTPRWGNVPGGREVPGTGSAFRRR